MAVSFPSQQVYDSTTMTVNFPADDGNQRILCRIS